jgi:hypothetical protein
MWWSADLRRLKSTVKDSSPLMENEGIKNERIKELRSKAKDKN